MDTICHSHLSSPLWLLAEEGDTIVRIRSSCTRITQLPPQCTGGWEPRTSFPSDYFHCHNWLFLCQSHFPSLLQICHFRKNDSVWYCSQKRIGRLGRGGNKEEKGKGGKEQNYSPKWALQLESTNEIWNNNNNYVSKAGASCFPTWIFIPMLSSFLRNKIERSRMCS